MSYKSRIEWTDATWNPVTGCSPVSPGCANCYAAKMARRLEAMGSPKYVHGFEPRAHPESLEDPDKWRRGRRVFVCSMGDLFHWDIPLSFIRAVFETMERNDQHVFQVLTKRHDRLREVAGSLPWPPNVWLGVSVEDDYQMHRVVELAKVPAAVRFVSLEPLLGPVPHLLAGIMALEDPLGILDWIIVGGETGRAARPMPAGWPEQIRDAAVSREIPFFFKQFGDGDPDHRRERLLEGRLWNEIPSWTRRGGEHEE